MRLEIGGKFLGDSRSIQVFSKVSAIYWGIWQKHSNGRAVYMLNAFFQRAIDVIQLFSKKISVDISKDYQNGLGFAG